MESTKQPMAEIRLDGPKSDGTSTDDSSREEPISGGSEDDIERGVLLDQNSNNAGGHRISGTREESDSDVQPDRRTDEVRRRRHRRRQKGGPRHRLRGKPYYKMNSWSSSARENIKNAPDNTTQFLIEDHIESKVSPQIEVDNFDRRSNALHDSEFSETYNKINLELREENLRRMTKEQLITRCLLLEEELGLAK